MAIVTKKTVFFCNIIFFDIFCVKNPLYKHKKCKMLSYEVQKLIFMIYFVQIILILLCNI